MHELIPSHGEADVRGPARHRLEEHEVARSNLGEPDLLADRELIANLSRQPPPESRKHVLDEAAAIEARRIGAARSVRCAPKGQGGVDELSARGWLSSGRVAREVIPFRGGCRQRCARGKRSPRERTRNAAPGGTCTRRQRQHENRKSAHGRSIGVTAFVD